MPHRAVLQLEIRAGLLGGFIRHANVLPLAPCESIADCADIIRRFAAGDIRDYLSFAAHRGRFWHNCHEEDSPGLSCVGCQQYHKDPD
jgi:hypothetical protein